jgi:hypothetical protein
MLHIDRELRGRALALPKEQHKENTNERHKCSRNTKKITQLNVTTALFMALPKEQHKKEHN